jgi:hypothetical protein
MPGTIDRLAQALDTFEWSMAAVIFLTYTVIDALYAWYTLAVGARRPFAAASISFIMHFLLAFGVISYTTNPLYIVPLACGSWVGTYLVVRRGGAVGKT